MRRYNDSDIEFVTRHFRSDAFLPTRRFAPVVWWRRRPAIAAALAAGVLAVSAAVISLIPGEGTKAPVRETTKTTTLPAPPPRHENQIVRLEFSDAPLPEVVKSIEATYNIEIEGLDPETSLRLSLSYEGTAADLIDTINLLLGTELSIKR